MNKKQKGFSLAELLISLLIISIVLSAAIPTITKRSGASRENIWRWSDQNNSIYAALGSNQAALLGIDRVPETSSATLITDDAPNPDASITEEWKIPLADEIKFSNKGDKLVILKRKAYQDEPATLSSHISFYNTNSLEAGSAAFTYAGRIAMDPGNMAIGIGTLQNLNTGSTTVHGENTAIGHLALTKNYDGKRNTALGRKALTRNINGNYNTALGFGTLFDLGYDSGDEPSNNTAVGSLSQRYNTKGNNNTAVGFMTLYHNKEGYSNTAVGSATLSELTSGSQNTAIGEWACGLVTSGNGNVCLGYGAGYEAGSAGSDGTLSKNYGLYIGVPKISTSGLQEPSIITGHMMKETEGSVTLDKELLINAKRVAFRPFNGSANMFEFLSYSGTSGYEEQTSSSNTGRFGIANFNLRDVGGTISNYNEASTTLQFSAPFKNRTAYIQSFDPYNTSTDNTYFNDINFNNMLTLDFPKEVWYWGTKITDKAVVAIRAESPKDDGTAATNKYPLILNDILKLDNAAAGGTVKFAELNFGDSTNYSKAIIGDNFYDIDFKNSSSPTEEFALSSDNGLNFKTSKTFIVDSSSSNPSTSSFSEIKFKNVKLQDRNDVQLEAKGDIWVKGANSFDTVNGSVKESFKQIKDALDQLRNNPSDARLKNISGDNIAGLKEINALQVKNFTYKKDEKKTPHVGVIAQQLQQIFPNAVSKDEDGYLRIRTEDIFYAMVNSIKELCKQIQDLTAKITGLDKRITALEKQNKQLMEQNKAFEKRLAKLEKQSAQKK